MGRRLNTRLTKKHTLCGGTSQFRGQHRKRSLLAHIRAGDFDAQCNSVVVLTSVFAANSTCSQGHYSFVSFWLFGWVEPFSIMVGFLLDSLQLLKEPGGSPLPSWPAVTIMAPRESPSSFRPNMFLSPLWPSAHIHNRKRTQMHVHLTNTRVWLKYAQGDEWVLFALWVNDRTFQSFEVCIETVDDCALLVSSKQHPLMQAT